MVPGYLRQLIRVLGVPVIATDVFLVTLFTFGCLYCCCVALGLGLMCCLSRVCAVAQYAVLEANAKVNGRGPFSHPHPSETPQPISMSCQIYYYVPQGVDVQNLVGIDSAVTDLRMREKNTFCVNFFY